MMVMGQVMGADASRAEAERSEGELEALKPHTLGTDVVQSYGAGKSTARHKSMQPPALP